MIVVSDFGVLIFNAGIKEGLQKNVCRLITCLLRLFQLQWL
jgi:hypothetical protein